MNTTEMPCKELVELVTDYLEGELSSEDTQRFEAHLVNCPGCRTFLEQAKWAVRLHRKARIEIPTDVLAEMRRVFRDWRRSSR